MLKKRIISVGLAALMGASLLAGCGSSSGDKSEADTTKQTSETSSAAETTEVAESSTEEAKPLEGEITFWHSFTQGGRLDNIQAAADAFVKENPGVKINIETFSWADFYTKWTTGLASGDVPDMSTALPNHVVEMIDADAVIPLDGLIDEIGRDRFYEAPLTEMTAKDGHTYGIPIYSHAQVMWYRKDLLKKYNLEVPKTWDELYDVASKITEGENGKVYGCSVPLGTSDMMGARYLNFYVRSAGGRLLNDDNSANLTSKETIDGINYWVKMYKKNSPAESINYGVLDQATMYYQGTNAFDFNSGFQISGVETNSPDLIDQISCAPVPSVTGDNGITGYETSNIPMVIWKNSKHPEICEAFIKFLYQKEYYVPFLLSVPVGMVPALKDIAEDPDFLSDPTMKKFQNEFKTICTAVNEGTAIGMEKGPVPQAGLLTSQHVVEEMFQNIILNGADTETAAKEAQDKLDDLFSTLE